jgi:hypothetical protein
MRRTTVFTATDAVTTVLESVAAVWVEFREAVTVGVMPD